MVNKLEISDEVLIVVTPNKYLLKPWDKETFLEQLLIQGSEVNREVINGHKYYLVCKADELNDSNTHKIGYSSLNEFTEFLNNNNYYWGENPDGKSPCKSSIFPKLDHNCIDSCQGSCWNNSDIDYMEWEKKEGKTIYPLSVTLVLSKKEQTNLTKMIYDTN